MEGSILKILPAAPDSDEVNPKRLLALTASGAIRFGASVSGMVEEDSVFLDYPKPDGWNRDLPQLCGIRKRSHSTALEMIGQFLSEEQGGDPSKHTPLRLLQTHSLLAQLHGYMGDMEKSINEWKLAYQIAQTSVPDAMPNLQESLGAAYLHLSEMENEIYHNSTDLCLFPPANSRAHFEKKEESSTI